MSGEVPLGYRIKAEGAEDTINKLKQLHEELRKGTISTREYRQEHRDLTTTNRASVGEFNDIKNAIAASNPNLLEFTRSMSLFGSVANTAMSVMNTINLLTLANAGTNQKMSDALRQSASDYNDYVRDLSAYGPYDARTQAAYQKWQADLNVISNLQRQLATDSVQTGITVIVTSVAMVGAIAQTITSFKTLRDMGGAVAAALGTAGLAGGFILVAAAALSLGGALGAALNPNAQKLLDQLIAKYGVLGYAILSVQSILINLDNIFGGTATDWDSFVRDAQQTWGNFVNSFVDGANQIISFRNSIAKVLGGQQIGLMQHIITPADVAQGKSADKINQMLVGTPFSSQSSTSVSPEMKELAAQTKQNAYYLQQQYSQILQSNNTQQNLLSNSTQGNDTLSSINSNVAGLLQPITDQKNAQLAVKDTITSSIPVIKQNIEDLKQQLIQAQAKGAQIYSSHAAAIESSPDITASNFEDIMDNSREQQGLQQQINDSQQRLATLQSKANALDNATSGLAPVLASIGLSADNGIGSIISGALGSSAGIGGAGFSAADAQQFVNTHDFGVFSKAFLRDNGIGSSGPSPKDQIAAWLQANSYLGDPTTHPYLTDMAKSALGFLPSNPGSSGNLGTGAFRGLPGQYGNPPPSMTININAAGSILANQDLHDFISSSVKSGLQASGF
jgi:hypothetical protein